MEPTKRSKISFLPVNLFWCLPEFGSCFLVCNFIFNNYQAILIALLYYILSVRLETEVDYLKDQNNLK